MKLKLQTDAERDLDALRNKLEMERQTQSNYTIQNRKVELQSQKDLKVMQEKDRLHKEVQEQMDLKHKQFDHEISNFKKDHNSRHEKELQYLKERYTSKYKLAKEKIEEENS